MGKPRYRLICDSIEVDKYSFWDVWSVDENGFTEDIVGCTRMIL